MPIKMPQNKPQEGGGRGCDDVFQSTNKIYEYIDYCAFHPRLLLSSTRASFSRPQFNWYTAELVLLEILAAMYSKTLILLSIALVVIIPETIALSSVPHRINNFSIAHHHSQMSMALPSFRKGRIVMGKLNNSKGHKSSIGSTLSADFGSSVSFTSRLKILLQSLIQKVSSLNDVGRWRVAAATFITSIYAFAPQIDLQLIKLWSWLQNDTVSLLPKLFRHDHWEWVVAISAFFFWIHGYWLVDRSIAKADSKGITHRWKKYRLQDQFEAEKFKRMQLRRAEAKGEEIDLNSLTPPSTKQHKWHLGFWFFELPLYCLPLYIWDICIPRRAAKLATWGAPTSLGICKDVTLALLLYDLGFFACHYLMHKIGFVYKYIHAKHHESTEVRASDIVRLSGVEEVVDVGISILALNFLKCHPASRTIYNVIITFLLTELHCGFAFPWTPQFVVPFGLSTGSKGHHYHHRNGKHYYQKFFCHVDKLFGFVQKKDSSLQGFSA